MVDDLGHILNSYSEEFNLQSVKRNLEALPRNPSNYTDKTPALYKM